MATSGCLTSAWLTCDKEVTAVYAIGALLTVALGLFCARVKTQGWFIAGSAVLFALAGGALYVAMAAIGSRFFGGVSGDPKIGAQMASAGFAFGAITSSIAGARLHHDPAPQPGIAPRTADAHHATLQRAAILNAAAAGVTAFFLAPTPLFPLPLAALAVSALVLALIARSDLAFEKRLRAIRDGKDERFAVLPSERGARDLPRVARWAADLGNQEPHHIVVKATPSYRESSTARPTPVASVRADAIDRAPRTILALLAIAFLLCSVVVGMAFVSAPEVSVPSAVRKVHGGATSYSTASNDPHIPGVLLYRVRDIAQSDYVLETVGYDPAKHALLTGRDLWLRISKDNAELLAARALELLMNRREHTLVLEEPPEIVGRDLSFTSAAWGSRGRARTGQRCTVNLDSGEVGACVDRAVPDFPPMR